MKRLFTFLLIIGVAILTISSVRLLLPNRIRRSELLPHAVHTTYSPTPSFHVYPNKKSMIWNNKTYQVSWFTVSDPNAVRLLDNTIERQSAQQILDSENCTHMINGGFYTEEGAPLGLLITERQLISDASLSTIADGYIWITHEGSKRIGDTAPSAQSARVALQSGPLLVINGQEKKLAIRSDEYARRMVAGITDRRTLIFLAFWENDNPYQGPLLADMPALVTRAESLIGLSVTDAINLDGGSASAFYDGATFLQELTPVGSFFCISQDYHQ